MAVMRKPGDDVSGEARKPKGKSGKEKKVSHLPSNAAAIKDWLTDGEDYVLTLDDSTLYAIPRSWKSTIDNTSPLRILHRGIKAAVIKGHDILPQHSLALSRALHAEAFPSVSITHGQAIAYLRKEAVVLPPDTPRGYVLLTYQGSPLGFVKNIGNRANNLYPQEWKVKSAHIPDDNVILSKI